MRKTCNRRVAAHRAVLLLCAAIALLLAACGGDKADPTPTPAPLVFPQDDSPHPQFNTEWWYYNGHLETADGQRYGFHYVVFEVRLPGIEPANIAHVAITDHQQRIFATDQRRAVAHPPPTFPGFSFSLGDWIMLGASGRDSLVAAAGTYSFILNLDGERPPALHGGSGFLDFGPAGSTYYYSRTRVPARGLVSVTGASKPASGQVWFDHQWGNFVPQAIQWDWFALQLDSGADLMLYNVRDGKGAPVAIAGTYVGQDGTAQPLRRGDFDTSATGSWVSPATGTRYPMGWRVRVPAQGIDVTLTPVIEHAEFDARRTTLNVYWEGQATVTGSHQGKGFVELVGYAPVTLPARTPRR